MNNHEKTLKLEIGNDYPLEFLSREYKTVSTPFGSRYVLPIKYEGKEMELKCTEKLKTYIDFYFKLHKQNKVKLSVFNGGNYNTTITNYIIINQ